MYQIENGDCLELMKSIPDKSIDMILADLPYGTTACSWDVIIPFEPLWDNYKRIIKPNGCIALFGSEPFSSYLRLSNIKQYKYDWIWNKTRGGSIFNAKLKPFIVNENISIFSNGKTSNGNNNNMPYYPILSDADIVNIRPINKGSKIGLSIYDNRKKKSIAKSSKEYNKNKRFPKNIIEISSYEKECNSLNRFHDTQKPISLLEYLIKTYTLENETVLDNTMGSGSTGVACIRTNRNFIGYEKDSNYFSIAKGRILEEIDKTSLFNGLGGVTNTIEYLDAV